MWASSVTRPAWRVKDWQTVQTTCKWVASRCWVNVNKLSDNVKTLGFVCVWWGRGLGTGEESMVGLFISWILRIHPAWVKAATTFFITLPNVRHVVALWCHMTFFRLQAWGWHGNAQMVEDSISCALILFIQVFVVRLLTAKLQLIVCGGRCENI